MGIPWSAPFPVVHVPQSAEPKRFTIILPFYQNPQFFRTQVNRWHTYAPHLKAHLSSITVDDGTRVFAPADCAEVAYRGTRTDDGEGWRLQPLTQPFPMRLFEIEVDVRWNWIAARNIGAEKADDGWLLLTDMDHVLPQSTADALVYGKHDPRVVYAFSREEDDGKEASPHSASFFMTKKMFWKIGGYDETFSGLYGSDGRYRRRLVATAPLQILKEKLIRYERQGDSSTVRYLRKQPEDAVIQKRAASIPKGAKPKVLSFPYHEISLC